MSRLSYVARRLAIMVALIFLIVTVLFFFFRSMPGGYLDIMAESGAGPEQIANLEETWGLDEPLHVQYFVYLQNAFTGDMGTSIRFGEPVVSYTLDRLFNSFILVGPAVVAGYILGSIIGVLMGIYRDSIYEKVGVVGVTFFGTLPEFFLGILVIMVFAELLGLFPISGMLSLSTRTALPENASFFAKYLTLDFLWHYFLPFLTIALIYVYYSSLVMRTSVVEVMDQDFNYYHRVTGLPRMLRIRKLMKHASLPVITILPASLTRAIGGMVLVEIVFNWPGIGKLLVDAVSFRDFPIIQFIFILVAIWIVAANFVVDIMYGIIDPRISIED